MSSTTSKVTKLLDCVKRNELLFKPAVKTD